MIASASRGRLRPLTHKRRDRASIVARTLNIVASPILFFLDFFPVPILLDKKEDD